LIDVTTATEVAPLVVREGDAQGEIGIMKK